MHSVGITVAVAINNERPSYVHSSFAIILLRKRELVALLSLSSLCLIMVVWLFLTVTWSRLWFVIVIFPDHIHSLFWCQVTNSDTQSLEELNRSLEKVSMRKNNIWVLGDFNFPKFSWDSEHVPTIKPGCKYPSIYNSFIS